MTESVKVHAVAGEKNWHLIKEMAERLKALDPYKVVLFGSYASGNPTDDSDIDVVVILDSDEIPQTHAERTARREPVTKAVRDIRYKIPMDIVIYSKAEIDYFREVGNSFFDEIETTGKVLYEKRD